MRKHTFEKLTPSICIARCCGKRAGFIERVAPRRFQAFVGIVGAGGNVAMRFNKGPVKNTRERAANELSVKIKF